jgi:hypothetical protein
MTSRFYRAAVVAVASCTLAGGAAVAYGHGGSSPAGQAREATSAVGQSFTFVDHELSRGKQSLTYTLPKLPPGPYAVSLFAALEPAGDVTSENLYCQINDTTKQFRILVATTTWTGDSATFVSASSAARVSADSQLHVICEAEHGPFTFVGDPLRVTFVRLASLQATALEPSSSF